MEGTAADIADPPFLTPERSVIAALKSDGRPPSGYSHPRSGFKIADDAL